MSLSKAASPNSIPTTGIERMVAPRHGSIFSEVNVILKLLLRRARNRLAKAAYYNVLSLHLVMVSTVNSVES